MSLTLPIAIVGAVTGISGLVLNYLSYRRTASHLKINFPDIYKAFFCRKSAASGKELLERYNTNAFAVIPVEITNKSDKPITIHAIKCTIPNQKFPMRHDSKMLINYDLLNFKLSDHSGSVTYNTTKSLKLPLRLEPFDYATGSVRFPFFEKAISETSVTTEITVAFYTSRRTYRKKVQLIELNELFHRQYPQHKDKVE